MGSRSYGFVVSNGIRDEEFNEEDIWAFGREHKEMNSPTPKFTRPREPPTFGTLRRIPTASRMIPRTNNPSSSSSSSSSSQSQSSNLVDPIVVQQSAPVNIPDWSKIYKRNLNKKGLFNGLNGPLVDGVGVGDGDGNYGFERDFNGGDDDEEEDDEWLPPHEFIAKKLATSQISSFSVCEGAGRTLKGRDLTKVRNAVLSRTGFLQ
ncbi:hypothetical protein Scep_012937 [Stephania cephalantha]|uniref:Senescence regulator n=1 Tax=Stephania cephalantha TaxID=152367 RepID=A0AAP0JG13_9MAGN